MDANKPLAGLSVLLATALMIGSGLLAGGGVWYLQHRATAAAEDRAAAARAEADRLERRVRELESQLTSRSPQGTSDGEEPPEPAGDAEEPRDAAANEKRIGFVKKASWSGGDLTLVIDYAEMLTGEDAASAYEEDGLGTLDGEQYYIRNRNTKLRTLEVAEDAEVVVSSWFSETEEIAPKTIALGAFADAMPGGASPQERLYAMPYWFTLTGGEVVRIEEQFLP